MNKKVLIIITILIIFLILVISISIIYFSFQKEKEKTMTAFDGLSKANLTAKNYNSESILYSITNMDSLTESGKSTGWHYYYIIQIDNDTIEMITVNIYTQKFEELHSFGTAKNITKIGLYNWSLDSDEAVIIAKKNSKIHQFLSKYSDATLDGVTLKNENNFSDAIWTISWCSPGLLDDPHNAVITINAKTGEIITGEVQL